MDAIFYKMTALPNGNYLLERNIIDAVNYNITMDEHNNIHLIKIIHVNITIIDDIKKYDFKKSIITDCKINNTIFTKLKYSRILCKIYELINDGTKIIKHTTLNIKTIEKHDLGFFYLPNIGISIQNADSNKCLFEIMNQSILHNITLSIKISLSNNTQINIQI